MNKFFVLTLILTVLSSTAWADVLPLQTQQLNDSAEGELVLNDHQGMSLYVYTPDKADQSNCKGGCIKAWPAVVLAGAEIEKIKGSKNLAVITRDDGSQQLTLDHKPLYYYVGDSQPGDHNGQGLGGVWFLLQAQFALKN